MKRWYQFGRRAPGRSWLVVMNWTVSRSLVHLWMKLCYRVRLGGHEHLPERGPVVFVSNHQSHLDPMIVGLLIGDFLFASLARDSLFAFRPFGALISLYGAVPMSRDRGDAGAFKNALAYMERGGTVLIFPEGTRSRDGRTAVLRRGALVLARRSGATIVPVAVEGAHDIWPNSRSRPRPFGRLAVKAGPPIDLTNDQADDDTVLESLRRNIEMMRLELREELRARSGGRVPATGAADQPYWGVEASDSDA